MTDEDEALCSRLVVIAESYRSDGYTADADDMEDAARRIRELSAEVEALKPWKETVRDLFDDTHFRTSRVNAHWVREKIEADHHDYFCGPDEKEMNDDN